MHGMVSIFIWLLTTEHLKLLELEGNSDFSIIDTCANTSTILPYPLITKFQFRLTSILAAYFRSKFTAPESSSYSVSKVQFTLPIVLETNKQRVVASVSAAMCMR